MLGRADDDATDRAPVPETDRSQEDPPHADDSTEPRVPRERPRGLARESGLGGDAELSPPTPAAVAVAVVVEAGARVAGAGGCMLPLDNRRLFSSLTVFSSSICGVGSEAREGGRFEF